MGSVVSVLESVRVRPPVGGSWVRSMDYVVLIVVW
jgi:hypothetical protein